MKKLKIYRHILLIVLILDLVALAYVSYLNLLQSVPDNINILVNEESQINLSLPLEAGIQTKKPADTVEALNIENAEVNTSEIKFSMQNPVKIQSSSTGAYDVKLKLFGLFNIKSIKLNVIDDVQLIPCGMPVGIYVQTDGLLVLGTGVISGLDGLNYEPALNILQSGDYILKVNQVPVDTIENMTKEIQKSQGKELTLELRRKGNIINVKLKPREGTDHVFKIGAWVREDTQGIGTMTYISDKGVFGALGHGITDSDTGVLLNILKGSIYQADIMKIIKGQRGKPGEIVGLINLSDSSRLGDITQNTNLGIYGNADINKLTFYNKTALPICMKQDIQVGKAKILCQIHDKIEEYEIEIQSVDLGSDDNKGMVIKVTDPKLLNQTNGIIQGMSGSPIIQDDKLVGAVTHVLVQDSTKGYGTFIENMLPKQ